MRHDFEFDIERVKQIQAVPTILEVVCRTTGMRFAAVARVTEERWIACSVLDQIQFGLQPGGELKIDSTICHEIRQSREPVVIDHVAEDQDWCGHPTPAMYGFQSYVSVPIILADGSFFGTLCAIDPLPARVRTPETIGMFRLFAELIARNLDAGRRLAETESALLAEREESEWREQFIAVLGHDLRTPVRAIGCLLELMERNPLDGSTQGLVQLMRNSNLRMRGLIDNLLDLARGRLKGGLPLALSSAEPLEPVLQTVIAELAASYPSRAVEIEMALEGPVPCDRERMAQLLSNLLNNALTYGSADHPVRVRAVRNNGFFELSVANAGDPIPAEAFEHLFRPFHRNSAVHSREGLGLGLYIAHEIAKAHGGTLEVESHHDQTRFTFRMRVAGQPRSAA